MTTSVVIIAAVVIVVAMVTYLLFRKERSRKLRSRFGPEYEHAVYEYGSSPKAEDALLARQKRMEKVAIHSLPPDERSRFAEEWREVQSRFVDDPAASIRRADEIVCSVMTARGYPMSDFEGRAEDLSVDYPQVVRNYRSAHAIALKQKRGEATTEELRQGLVHYRELFDELLEAHMAGRRTK